MKRLLFIALMMLPILSSAKEVRVTLDLPGMNCAMCPITVKKALKAVNGVQEAKVSYAAKQAIVIFDDAQTSPAALIEATTNAGYPSTVTKEAEL